jgi:site-specific DNA-methyltransferase (adenine-specific)
MTVASPRNPARRHRPGEVRDAIERALADAGGPLHVREIHAAVADRLGGDVPASSVRSYLNLNTGTGKPFERVRRGVYRIA